MAADSQIAGIKVQDMPLNVPVLETGRLILRGPRLEDVDAFVAFGRSDRAQFVGGPYEPWQSWNAFLTMAGHWVMRGFGWWVLEDKATGATAGRIGVGYHLDWPEPELGWHVYDGFEGKGLAHEAALAARSHAYGVWGFGPLISLVAPENHRSIALAERLGAAPERETTIRGERCIIYRHPKEAA